MVATRSRAVPSSPSTDTPSDSAGDDTTVVVIAAGTGRHAPPAALAAAGLLSVTAGAVVPAHAGTPGLDGLVESATGVYVLDPDRLQAWRHRRHVRRRRGSAAPAKRALTAPAAGRDRLALVGLLADRPARVRWITRPGQLEQLAGEGRL